MTSKNYPADKRKSEHIDIVLNQKVTGTDISTGFEAYQFRHNALPEINFDDVSLHTTFLGKTLKAPFLVSSMTGGTDQAWKINKHLAIAAEEQGWAMGLGSVRAAIEQPSTAYTFQLREYAPTIPILANLGAAQLNYGYGINECQKAVELTQADALIFHLNSLQEVFQPEGDTCFRSLIRQITEVCKKLDVPVGVKEVGWGIDGEVAKLLFEAGIHFIDVAGAGGTSWSQVEKYRSQHMDPLRYQAAEAFTDWGIPTTECVIDVRQRNPQGTVISSGGLYTGVEGAKSIALGADLAGYGRSLLTAATESTPKQLRFVMQRIELECKIAMFGIGAANLSDLKRTNRIQQVHTRTTFRT